MNDHAYSDTLAGAQKKNQTTLGASPLVVGAQYLQRLHIDIQNTPSIFENLPQHLHLGLTVDVTARQLSERQNGFEVVLVIRAQGMKSAPSDAVPHPTIVYDVTLSYGGLFGFGQPVEKDVAEAALLVEAPHYLFPAARSVLLNAVREAGFPVLNLQPIDFETLWHTRRGQHQ